MIYNIGEALDFGQDIGVIKYIRTGDVQSCMPADFSGTFKRAKDRIGRAYLIIVFADIESRSAYTQGIELFKLTIADIVLDDADGPNGRAIFKATQRIN